MTEPKGVTEPKGGHSYFTKPSQGARFKNYRDYIMGYKPISELLRSTFSSMKERVENMNQTKKESHNTNVVTTIN